MRLVADGRDVEGWALNISNGGLRCIVDTDGVDVDALFALGRVIDVHVGDAGARPARIVWVQSEPDGAIIGVAFTDHDLPPSTPPPGSPPKG